MSDKHDTARAALEAALAATSGGSGGAAPEPIPAWHDPRLGSSAPEWALPAPADQRARDADGSGTRVDRPARDDRDGSNEGANRGGWGDHRGRDEDGGERRARGGRRGGRRSRRGSQVPADPEGDLQGRDHEPDHHDVARQIVLRQLAMAPRSRQQLEDKLRQRNCPDEVAAEVLDRMTEVGLVDDVAYAEMLVRSKQAERGLARRALAQELRTKGIDAEIAAETLEGIDEDAERARARQLVDKKLRTMHGLGVDVQTRRLAGMLARKGYSSGMSYAVIRDAIADSEEYLTD